METQAEQAAKEALIQVRSIEFFPLIQATFLVIALLLLKRFYDQYGSRKAQAPLSPKVFSFIAFVIMGMSGFFSMYWGLSNAVFAFSFSACLVASLVEPVIGLSLLIACSLLRPWEATKIAEMAIIPKSLGLIVIGSWLFHGVRRRRLGFLFNWPIRFFFFFALWVLLSALTSLPFEQGLSEFMNTMMIAAILFLLMSNVPETREDLALLQRVWVLSIAGVIVHAFMMTVTQIGFDASKHRMEGVGLTGNSNDLAALVVQVLPFAVVPALRRSRGEERDRLSLIVALGAVPVFLAGLWLAQSRGAVLAAGLSLLVVWVFRAKNPKKVMALATMVSPLFLVVLSILSATRDASDIEGSTASRFSFLIAGARMAIHHPIMGVGFSNFPKLFEQFAGGSLTYEWGQRTAHSTWVLAMAETGFTGLMLILAVFLSTLKRAWRMRRAHPEIIAALLGYSVAMSFLSHTYTFFPYLLFALVLSASKIYGTMNGTADSISSGASPLGEAKASSDRSLRNQ